MKKIVRVKITGNRLLLHLFQLQALLCSGNLLSLHCHQMMLQIKDLALRVRISIQSSSDRVCLHYRVYSYSNLLNLETQNGFWVFSYHWVGKLRNQGLATFTLATWRKRSIMGNNKPITEKKQWGGPWEGDWENFNCLPGSSNTSEAVTSSGFLNYMSQQNSFLVLNKSDGFLSKLFSSK